MRRELECEGRVLLGPLPPETSARLARFSGSWLEFVPEDSAIVVRHVQPTGCPALSGVPCELITLLDVLPSERREKMPGGVLYLRDATGQIVRLVVSGGEVRIQWAHEDYAHAIPVSLNEALAAIDPVVARVKGFASFLGPEEAPARLRDFVDSFEGLYPEGSVDVGRERDSIRARFDGVNVGPRELLETLRGLAVPPDSLEADLEVSSFTAGSMDGDFRIRVSGGAVRAERPSFWKNG